MKTNIATLICLISLASTLLAQTNTSQPLRVGHLTCEYSLNPVGIDQTAPLLGWRIYSDGKGALQTAYRVMVATDAKKLAKDDADMWDSGKVSTSQSQNIRYQGKTLQTGQSCHWKVRVWDRDGRATEWSAPASWSMGILSGQEWGGKWISNKFAEVSSERSYMHSWGGPPDYKAPDTAAVYFRKTFDAAKRIKRATAYICGLGYYELYINGGKVGDRVMDPVFTDYQRKVNYATYDLTSSLKKGKNTIGVILGNGFYNLPTKDLFQMENAHWKTPPKLRVNIIIEYASGQKQTIVTDETWKWSTGEIVFNCIRGGETIDHTRQQRGWNLVSFDDSGWSEAVTVPAPVGQLKAQSMPPIKINEKIRPVKITQPKKGLYLVDFGKNITGWIQLTTAGNKGQSIRCDYNEHLHGDGTLNTGHSSGHTGGRFQKDIFILDGNGQETFEPRFIYHGFRYVQLQGLAREPSPEDIIAKSVHTALDTTGYFNCSDERFNNMQQAIQRTMLNSVHSMPAEEPTREKMGWTLDAGVLMESYLYNFDAINTYKKSLQDFMDAQEPSGHIASIVPTNGWVYLMPEGVPNYWDDPWWGGAIFIIADNLFNYTGDTAIIAHAFDALKRYADFVASTTKDDLVYWSLGDWLDLKHNEKGPGLTPVVQTSTAGYYWMNERISVYARMLGKDVLSDQYAANAKRIRNKFNDTFLNRGTGWYAENSQTAQALPLFLGMVPDDMKSKVEARLLDAIAGNNGHISAGFIGANPVLEYLPLHGHFDKAFAMVSQPDTPGWLHMVKDGNSTMGENLNAKGVGSGHHPYGAHVGFWLFKYLGGIRPDITQPGFRQFIIEPQFVSGMEHISIKTQSLYGEIVSSWKRESGRIQLRITIPGNTSAKLLLPLSLFERDIIVDGKALPATSVTKAIDKAVLTMDSGTYLIELFNNP